MYINGRSSKIRTVHMYVMSRTVYFDCSCMFESHLVWHSLYKFDRFKTKVAILVVIHGPNLQLIDFRLSAYNNYILSTKPFKIWSTRVPKSWQARGKKGSRYQIRYSSRTL